MLVIIMLIMSSAVCYLSKATLFCQLTGDTAVWMLALPSMLSKVMLDS